MPSQTICKFYLQGQCKFGNKCWHKHTRPQQQTTQHAQGFASPVSSRDASTFRSSFSSGQNPYRYLSNDPPSQQKSTLQTSHQPASDIVRGLPEEMVVWEKSKMWPFSCYGFEKEAQCLPGLTDLSQEELRLEAYEAKNTGNSQQFVNRMQQLLTDANVKKQQLRQPDPQTKQKLIEYIDQCRNKGVSTAAGAASVSSTPSVFGSKGGSSFGATQPSTSNNPFNSQSSGSAFGSSGQAAGSSGSAFRSSGQATGSSGSAFGSSAQATGSVFGSPQNVVKPSVFGASAQTGSSAFGNKQPQSAFGNKSENNSFGNQTNASAFASKPSVFGSNANSNSNSTTNAFGSNQSANSVFGSKPQLGNASMQQPSNTQSAFGSSGSAFGSAQPASGNVSAFGSSANVFGSAQPSGSAPQTSGSVFAQNPFKGGSTDSSSFSQMQTPKSQTGFLQPAATGSQNNTSASIFGSSQSGSIITQPSSQSQSQTHGGLYTPLSELTLEERQQFEAPKFTLGKIPMRPPPKELVH